MAGVKLLSESVFLQNLVNTMKADLFDQEKERISQMIKALPNESNGDAIPASGNLYLSGDGVVKIA